MIRKKSLLLSIFVFGERACCYLCCLLRKPASGTYLCKVTQPTVDGQGWVQWSDCVLCIPTVSDVPGKFQWYCTVLFLWLVTLHIVVWSLLELGFLRNRALVVDANWRISFSKYVVSAQALPFMGGLLWQQTSFSSCLLLLGIFTKCLFLFNPISWSIQLTV